MYTLKVTQKEINKAEEHIQYAIENAHTAVDLTAKGVMAHVLLSLGITLTIDEEATACGHAAYGKAMGKMRCAMMACENYYMRHWTRGK